MRNMQICIMHLLFAFALRFCRCRWSLADTEQEPAGSPEPRCSSCACPAGPGLRLGGAPTVASWPAPQRAAALALPSGSCQSWSIGAGWA